MLAGKIEAPRRVRYISYLGLRSKAKMNPIFSPAPGSLTVGIWSEFLQNLESEVI